MLDVISFVFIFIILVINFYAFYIAKNYFNISIDIYNHKAFINSIECKYIIPSSAIREANTYPPVIHLLYRVAELFNLTQYFSFVFFCFNQIVAFSLGFFFFDINFALELMLISTLSTSLILDVRTYNARMLGVFLYNLLFFTIIVSLDNSLLLIPLQILLCICIVFASRFSHQMIWFVLLPASIILGATDFLFSYLSSVLLLFFIFKGHGISIVKGHLAHLRYYFFNGVEFWAFNKYWREYGQTAEKSRFSNLIYPLKSFKIFFRQPVTIAIVLFFICGSFAPISQEHKFALYCLGFGTTFYLITAASDRVNKFIGDGFRYWEYLLVPFGVSVFFAHSELQVIIALISLVVLVVTHRDLRHVSKNILRTGRSGDDNLKLLCQELDKLDKINVMTLPISLSNILSVNTNKKYFYAYTFFGFWFLNRKGIFPWFKRGKNNLLNSNYINYLVVDSNQIDEFIVLEIISEYEFVLMFSCGHYMVFKKNNRCK
ncbi:hypothetical protein EGC79_13280 [Shewanella vesiculosa]|uniref:hypothetical protein n=1 Tax=Shewanella vesiculosa TaxID=518738 RepID=UPI000F50A528|nr:hypothetical protein [Shewanella vesiculosa]RPA46607.1 hypothetical protein EGC79_13280 [Shewanella vesiculosa]UJL42924.1 hypothetical protein KDH10_000094 [Shewanella vesiculosa]